MHWLENPQSRINFMLRELDEINLNNIPQVPGEEFSISNAINELRELLRWYSSSMLTSMPSSPHADIFLGLKRVDLVEELVARRQHYSPLSKVEKEEVWKFWEFFCQQHQTLQDFREQAKGQVRRIQVKEVLVRHNSMATDLLPLLTDERGRNLQRIWVSMKELVIWSECILGRVSDETQAVWIEIRGQLWNIIQDSEGSPPASMSLQSQLNEWPHEDDVNWERAWTIDSALRELRYFDWFFWVDEK